MSAKDRSSSPFRAIAIASSTGGPPALTTLFEGLRGKLPHLPIFITQHMPATFTPIFAQQLSEAGGCDCREGKDGEAVSPVRVYLAPGGYHMEVHRGENGRPTIHLTQDPPVNSCRPAADPMFNTISEVYGPGLLAVVLTGIGQDGTEGAKTIVKNGGTVIAQDEASSVVYGMPKTVAEQVACKAILPLNEIAAYIIKATS